MGQTLTNQYIVNWLWKVSDANLNNLQINKSIKEKLFNFWKLLHC